MTVADAWKYFDVSRYVLGDLVIMPNHVYLLGSFPGHSEMLKQFDSWLHFTARQIKIRHGLKDKLGQGAPLDRLVRSPEQLKCLRGSIECNPDKAGLMPGRAYYWRRPVFSCQDFRGAKSYVVFRSPKDGG